MKSSKKIVLITGAAHGLGRALADKFLASGWHVIATDKDDLSMAWLLESENTTVLPMDITSDDSVNSAFICVKRHFDHIDLIVNNAGTDGYFPLSETPVDRFREMFEVNVFGGYRVNQTFLPILRQPGGRIIHISSESLNLEVPFMPYPLTKRLVEGYARVLRMELGFLGIDVVIVRPGAIATRLLETVSNIDPGQQGGALREPFRRFAETASTEIGRIITPEAAADFIYKVSCKLKPAAVYRINNMLQLRLAARLPYRWLERIIAGKLKT